LDLLSPIAEPTKFSTSRYRAHIVACPGHGDPHSAHKARGAGGVACVGVQLQALPNCEPFLPCTYRSGPTRCHPSGFSTIITRGAAARAWSARCPKCSPCPTAVHAPCTRHSGLTVRDHYLGAAHEWLRRASHDYKPARSWSPPKSAFANASARPTLSPSASSYSGR